MDRRLSSLLGGRVSWVPSCHEIIFKAATRIPYLRIAFYLLTTEVEIIFHLASLFSRVVDSFIT